MLCLWSYCSLQVNINSENNSDHNDYNENSSKCLNMKTASKIQTDTKTEKYIKLNSDRLLLYFE